MEQFLADEVTIETRRYFDLLTNNNISLRLILDCRREINEYGLKPEDFFAQAMQNNDVLAIGDPVVHEHRPIALRLLPWLKSNGASHIFVRVYSVEEQEQANEFILLGSQPDQPDNQFKNSLPLLKEARRLGLALIPLYHNPRENPQQVCSSIWDIALDCLEEDYNQGSKLIFWDNFHRIRKRNEAGETFNDAARLHKNYNHNNCTTIGLRSPLCPNAFDPTPWATLVAADLQFPVVVPTMMATSLGSLPISSIINHSLQCWDYVIIYPLARNPVFKVLQN